MIDAKVAVYTSIIPHDYVQLQPPLYINEDRDQVHYWCISDAPQSIYPWWDLIAGPFETSSSLREIQRYRVQSHRIWPEYDYTIWVDGEVRLKADPLQLVDMLKESGYGIGFVPHPQRDCIYDEAEVYLSFKAVDPATVAAQLDRYRAAGFPAHQGLAAVNFFIRDNRDPDVIRLMERWHYETQNGCCRTQMSFPFASWIENVPWWKIPWEVLGPEGPTRKMRIWQDNVLYRRKGFMRTDQTAPEPPNRTYQCMPPDPLVPEIPPPPPEPPKPVEPSLQDKMFAVSGLLDAQDRVFLRQQAERAEQLFGIPTIVNIGVAKGASCYCLRLGSPKAKLIGVDPLGPEELEGTPEMLQELGLQYIAGFSQKVYGEVDEPIHLIFVDGDHCCEGVSNDIRYWVLPHIVSGGVAIFHDARFADGDPFHHVGIEVSKAIDTLIGDDWEEQELVFQSRWFIRK